MATNWNENKKKKIPVIKATESVVFIFKDIDECVNHTCVNGGSCKDGVNNYSCNCLPGFTGDRCQTGKYFPLFLYCTFFLVDSVIVMVAVVVIVAVSWVFVGRGYSVCYIGLLETVAVRLVRLFRSFLQFLNCFIDINIIQT